MNRTKTSLLKAAGVAAFAGILFMGAYYFLASNASDLNDQNRQYLKEISQQNANSIKTLVNKDLDALHQLAQILGGDEAFSEQTVMDTLLLVQKDTDYKRMGYIRTDGRALTTDKVAGAFDASDREYFKIAMTGVTNASDRLADKVDNSGDSINVYATPLYHQGTLEGVLIATNNTKRYADSIAVESFGGEGFSYIIKADGTPVVFSENKNALDRFDNLFAELQRCDVKAGLLEEMQANIARGETGVIEYSRGGVPRVAAYSKVGINDWYVVSVVPTAAIYDKTSQMLHRNTTAVAVVLLMSVSFIAMLAYLSNQNRKELETMAYVDKLTGGNNYKRFLVLCAERLARRHADKLCVVYIDIDNFRLFNDIYGYKEGDEVLRAMDATFRAILPENAIYGRIAGDTFVCLLEYESEEQILELDGRFRAAFHAMLDSQLKSYNIIFTTGAYCVQAEETDVSKAVDKAAMAHHHIKKRQADKKVSFYTDKIRDDAVRVKRIEDTMQKALEEKRFLVYLQPKYFLYDESIGGMEALVRWQTPDGIANPNDFIPVFEQNGFIITLDMYMLESACRIIAGWIEAGIKPVPVSVNFSKQHLHNSAFVAQLCAVVDSFDIARSWIEIELTETAIYDNCEMLRGIIAELHAAGFAISMDDFGSGSSSLGLLKDLPVDVIKIDRSFFVVEKGEDRSKIVVGSVIDMARKLGIHTVAEGVEEQASIDLLHELHCDMVQGYYYARPMPEADAAKLLRAARGAALPV